jgi:glycine oxidase
MQTATSATSATRQSGPPPDVLIVGGGIAGATLAFRLTQAGARVTLIDREAPGHQASGGYAGLLTTVADGHEHDAYAALSQQALQCILETVPELQSRSGVDVELTRSPLLRLADDEASMSLLQRYAQREDARAGGDIWLQTEELRARLAGVGARVQGAMLSPVAYHLNPRALLAATLRCATSLTIDQNFNAHRLLLRGQRVLGVADAAGRELHAGHVVLATGAWGAELLLSAGVELRLRPLRGQLVVLDGTAMQPLDHIVNTGRGYIVPKRGGLIVVGATQDDAGFDKSCTLSGFVHLSRVAGAVRGLAALPVVQTFVGLRPMSPDGKPLLGTANGLQGLTLALGYGQHGVLLSHLCADMCARHVLGGEPHGLWLDFQAQRAVAAPGESAAPRAMMTAP